MFKLLEAHEEVDWNLVACGRPGEIMRRVVVVVVVEELCPEFVWTGGADVVMVVAADRLEFARACDAVWIGFNCIGKSSVGSGVGKYVYWIGWGAIAAGCW